MLDLRNMTFNGDKESYCKLPIYLFQNLANDKRLTSSSVHIFLRLFAYASCVYTGDFIITEAWVAKETGLNRKTVARSLTQLKELGYITKTGIDLGAPQPKQVRATAKGYANHHKKAVAQTTNEVPSVTVNHLEPVLEVVTSAVKESLTTDPVGNPEPLADVSSELNDILRSLGSTKKVGQKVQPVEKPADKMPQPCGQIVQKDGQKGTSSGQKGTFHITNNINKQKENKQNSTPSVTVRKVGLLPSTSSRGFVEPSKPKSLATMLQSFTTGKPKTPKLDSKNTAYIETALVRMRVTSPSERARYQSEIAYAATQGAFADTFSHTPLKAIRACLNLVEAGRWKPNAGMYA